MPKSLTRSHRGGLDRHGGVVDHGLGLRLLGVLLYEVCRRCLEVRIGAVVVDGLLPHRLSHWLSGCSAEVTGGPGGDCPFSTYSSARACPW